MVQADGKILVGGIFNSIGGQTRNNIARLDATTGLADSFDPNANSTVYSIAVQADGKILAGGTFGNIGGQTRSQIGRLDGTTGLADSFDPNISPHVAGIPSIAVQADGKILLGGYFTTVTPNGGAAVARNNIARLEIDGRVDQTLDLNIVANRHVHATVVQPDGKILIGGSFGTVLGVTRNNIARLNTDGTLDMAFNPNASNQVSAIAVQADGKILAGGLFISIGGQPRNGMARLDGTTGLADSFDPNVNPIFPVGEGVSAIAVQADGKVLVGGVFTSVSGQTRNNIARLDAMTGLADSFDPNANQGVSDDRGAGGRQDFSGRQFHQHWWTDAPPHRPAQCRDRPGRFVRSERDLLFCRCNRGAGGRQDSGGRQFQRVQRANYDRRTDAQPHRPARWRDWTGRFVQPERERQCLCNRGAGGREDFGGRAVSQHRRTGAQPHRPARCHDRLG